VYEALLVSLNKFEYRKRLEVPRGLMKNLLQLTISSEALVVIDFCILLRARAIKDEEKSTVIQRARQAVIQTLRA
jgi:hypothetical protein